ncbi:thiol reductase thioredoxin [Lentilactobacillus curieae]|uniref:Thioredoxin n=1 Tax=Lentilactobacillus curieae TaxID=1138822 RepID=A0A1S6QGV4_9LACO|nr:thioredoxin [Lentilactobacillus curieae]AQW20835.1 thiol reductase thioredoxin [Lentilactobacillus curieae]
MSVTITRDNLNSEVDNDITVIDFWAPWCGPCKMMDPILETLETQYEGKIHFGKMNVDNNQDIAEQYKVMSIPSLVIFKNGEAKEKITGVYPKEKLANYLDKKLAEVKDNK